MNSRRTPFLRFFWPLSAGLLLGGLTDLPLSGLGMLICFLSIGLVLLSFLKFRYRLRWIFGIWTHILLFCFGYWYIIDHNETRRSGHFSAQLADIRCVIGMVYDAPVAGNKLKIPVRVEWVGATQDSMIPAVGNLLCFADTGSLDLKYGDRIYLQTSPRATEGAKNPYAFNYGQYLHFQNIHHVAYLKPDSVQLISSGHGRLIWEQAFASRQRVLNSLKRHFSTKDEYAVAGALLLGHKDDLSEEMRTAYAETGSMHALAVSGTHVSMLYVGLMFIVARFRRFFRKQWVETVLILFAIWSFTFLTGATASVLRASVMFSSFMVGKLFEKEPLIWNVLPTSASLLLLYNPYFLFDAGFQLSYAAVCGMIFFYPYLQRWTPLNLHWTGKELLNCLWVGVAAQLGTVPLSLYYFNQFPFFFWLAGWIVIFGGAIFLWGGTILIVLDAIWPFGAILLGKALWAMLWCMNKVIFAIHYIPGSVAKGVWVPIAVVILLYVCVVFLGKMFLTKQGKWFNAFLGLMLLLGFYRNFTMSQKSSQKRIVVYNASKHSCIDFFDGRKVYALEDSMGAKQSLSICMPNRWACGMRGEPVLISLDSTLSLPNLKVEGPFVQFYDKRVALIDHSYALIGQKDLCPADIVVLSKSPSVHIQDMHEMFSAKLIVFDASNSRKKVAKWKAECAELGITHHDVREKGAWMELW
jgi:competence protein ComEC